MPLAEIALHLRMDRRARAREALRQLHLLCAAQSGDAARAEHAELRREALKG